MAEGALDFALQFGPSMFPPHPRATEQDAMGLWMGVCRQAEQEGEDMFQAVREASPEMVLDIARDGGRLFREWAETLPPESNVLAIGHSPYLEMIVEDVTGVVLSALAPCEGVRMSFEQGIWTLLEECRIK